MGFNPFRQQRRRPSDYVMVAAAFAIIAANGDIYSGLWYPVITASIAFVVSLAFVRETKDVDIRAVS